MIEFTFRQLEVFVQIVETGSARACAEHLSISQVSVSEHIRTLERHIGCPLFHRRRGGAAVLTNAGERTYCRARDVLEGAAGMLAGTARGPARRKLRIAAHGLIAERFCQELADFAAAHPDLDIELERLSFEGMLQRFLNAEIEVGFFLSNGPVSDLESDCAWREEMAFFVGESHPLAGTEIVTPPELSRFPCIYLPSSSHLRGQFDVAFAAIGVRDSPAGLTSDDHLLAVKTLMAGTSYACLPVRAVEELSDRRHLRRLRMASSLPGLHVRYVLRGAYRHDRTVKLLIRTLSSAGTGTPDDHQDLFPPKLGFRQSLSGDQPRRLPRPEAVAS